MPKADTLVFDSNHTVLTYIRVLKKALEVKARTTMFGDLADGFNGFEEFGKYADQKNRGRC